MVAKLLRRKRSLVVAKRLQRKRCEIGGGYFFCNFITLGGLLLVEILVEVGHEREEYNYIYRTEWCRFCIAFDYVLVLRRGRGDEVSR